MEILCDTRLTIRKSDEVVKDSLAELFNHLHMTRINMVKQVGRFSFDKFIATFSIFASTFSRGLLVK